MERRLALIGFGEAARTFAPRLSATCRAYDPIEGTAMRDAMTAARVRACATPRAALDDAEAVLSLVTADQAVSAAEAADGLAEGAWWFDMNSVAPDTKRAAAAAIGAHGGRYVDVAVMAPVHPDGTAVPLLVAGPDANDGAVFLRGIGFGDVSVVGDAIGGAAAVKLIRSVMVKGIEALSAECASAAEAIGVRDTVVASLDASWPGADWGRRIDRNLERMMRHGARRAAEMDEVVAMLEALGTGAEMSRATARCQRAIGARDPTSPARGDAKLAALTP